MHSVYKLTAILFGIGVTMHNLEEALYWPGWVRSNLTLSFEPNQKIYWALTSSVSAVIWISIAGVCISPASSLFTSVLSGFALAVAINAVFPHLALTLVKHSYSPGTATGMLLNLPLGVLLIWEQLDSVTTSHAHFWRDAVFYALLSYGVTFGTLYGAHAIFAARRP